LGIPEEEKATRLIDAIKVSAWLDQPADVAFACHAARIKR
jgi:hypothetical protein